MAKPPIVIDGIAQVEGAIRQPGNPHHYMVAKPVDKRVRIWRGERLVADTTDALCLIEIGRKALQLRNVALSCLNGERIMLYWRSVGSAPFATRRSCA